MEQIFVPCDECGYSYSRQNQESGMCRICEFKKMIDLQNRLQNVYGECGGLLEKVIGHLEQHEGVDLPEPVFRARLLTDDEVDRWERYKDLEEQGKLLRLSCTVSDREWIPCSEQLPENEKDVEITYIRKHPLTGEKLYLTARAFYEDGTNTTEESAYDWSETYNWEDDEQTDAYRIPAGWFESCSFTEELGNVDMPVIAWRPLPDPYHESLKGSD